jgi:hypothetical protein
VIAAPTTSLRACAPTQRRHYRRYHRSPGGRCRRLAGAASHRALGGKPLSERDDAKRLGRHVVSWPLRLTGIAQRRPRSPVRPMGIAPSNRLANVVDDMTATREPQHQAKAARPSTARETAADSRGSCRDHRREALGTPLRGDGFPTPWVVEGPFYGPCGRGCRSTSRSAVWK